MVMAPAPPAGRRMGACETTPPTTPRGHADDLPNPVRKGLFLALDDPPPLVGVQLVRPRRCAAAGAPAGPLPHGDVNQAAARKIPANSHNPAQRHHASHRVKLLCPLDTSSPHGCRIQRADRCLPRRRAPGATAFQTGQPRTQSAAGSADSVTLSDGEAQENARGAAAMRSRGCPRAHHFVAPIG